MNQFFICQNPLLNDPGEWVNYIYHAVRPKFFAGVFEIDSKQNSASVEYDSWHKFFTYQRGDGQARILLLGVQSIFLPASNIYILSYAGGVKSFNTNDAMVHFLKDVLGYTDTPINICNQNEFA